MSDDSDTQDPKKEEEGRSKASRLIKKLDFVQISDLEKQTKDPGDFKPEGKEGQDPHAFPLLSDIIGSQRVKNIKSGRNNLLMGLGIFVGILLIIFGIMMLMGSVESVADNVTFGEKEVFSVFLILIGVLIIACSFAYKFMGKSFFKEINDDDNSSHKKSSHSAKGNIKKDNINRDNR